MSMSLISESNSSLLLLLVYRSGSILSNAGNPPEASALLNIYTFSSTRNFAASVIRSSLCHRRFGYSGISRWPNDICNVRIMPILSRTTGIQGASVVLLNPQLLFNDTTMFLSLKCSGTSVSMSMANALKSVVCGSTLSECVI